MICAAKSIDVQGFPDYDIANKALSTHNYSKVFINNQ